jgi:hypothetical protein
LVGEEAKSPAFLYFSAPGSGYGMTYAANKLAADGFFAGDHYQLEASPEDR